MSIAWSREVDDVLGTHRTVAGPNVLREGIILLFDSCESWSPAG